MARQKFFGIKVSKPGITVQQASDKQLVYKDTFSTKTFYDNDNSRIVQGLLPDGQYGMWVSKPGFDATDKTAPALNNLIFNSNEDIFRIATKQDAVLNIPAHSWTASYSYTQTYIHGLGYTPTVLMYFNNPALGTVYSGPINVFGFSGATGLDWAIDPISFSVDSIALYVTFTQFNWGVDPTRYPVKNDPAADINFTYFLLQNTLS